MQSLETLIGVLRQSLVAHGSQRAEAEASLRSWDAESPGILFKSLVSVAALIGSGAGELSSTGSSLNVDDDTGALALILARRAVDRLWRRGAPHEYVALSACNCLCPCLLLCMCSSCTH